MSWRGCPTAESGGEGAAGAGPQPSVVVAVGASPQPSSALVVVGNSGGVWSSLVKVQPSLVSIVVVMEWASDMVVDTLMRCFLVSWAGFIWVFLMELSDKIRGIFEVVCRIPGAVGVVEAGPLDSVLDFTAVFSGV